MTHPTINAALNAASAALLLAGYVAIRRGRRESHAGFMVAATAFSAAFLVSYVIYHASSLHTPYPHHDASRPVYFAVLISHVVLAAVNLPMVIRTLWLAGKRDFARHRRWARWTFPVWLYVSVTGVVVYWMLYWR